MTNGKRLQDAIGLIDIRYIAELSDQLAARRKRQRRLITIWAAAACFSLILTVGIGHTLSEAQQNRIADPYTLTLPTDADQIIWAAKAFDLTYSSTEDGIGVIASESAVSDSLVQMTWRGWELSGDLYLALEEAEADDYFAVLVSRRYDYNARMNFVYEGKTRGEWEVEYEILNAQQRRLGEFSKAGHLLKYGEALYTTGTPDGERWTKELYEQQIDYYGAVLIEKYIRDGEFLIGQLEADMVANDLRLTELKRLLVDLSDAYTEQEALAAYPIFAKRGISCGIRNGKLYLFLTKQDLSSRTMPRAQHRYVLSLASRRVFETVEGELPIEIDETLSGFDCSKITFYTDGARYNTVSSDGEVLDAIRYLLERWQYSIDRLSISVYADPRLNEETLASMHYQSVYYSTYSDLILLNIPMKDLNPEAIRDLSLLPQVRSIHIGPHISVDLIG